VSAPAFDRLDPAVTALLDDGVAAIRGTDVRREVDLLLMGGYWRLFLDPDRAIGLIEEAVAVARTTGDDRLVARALVNLASDLPPRDQNRLEQVVDELRRLPRAATEEIAFSYISLDTVEANLAMRHGDRQTSDEAMARFEARSSPRDFSAASIAAGRRYHVAMLDGRVEEGEKLRDAYLNASARAYPPFLHLTNMGAARLSRARALASFADEIPNLERMVAEAPELGRFQADLVVARALGGDLSVASEILDRQAADGFRTTLRCHNPHWDGNVADLALGAALCQHRATAEVIVEEVGPVTHLCASYYLWMFYGSFHHHLGLALATLGRYEEAADAFRAALPPEKRWGSKLWVITTTDCLGAVLEALGDPEGPGLRAEARRDAADAGIGLMTAAWTPDRRDRGRTRSQV
jgi:tetratricopeptide (TPR) repeat protein